MSDSLLEMQTWFAGIITRPLGNLGEFRLPTYDSATSQEIQRRVPATPHLSSEQRIGIYHQQYWWRLFGLLQDYYPALLRLFGHADFNRKIAEPYFLRSPPADWFLPNIATSLPAWIEHCYEGRDRPLVLQIARLDEAYERLFHAIPCPSIAPATLALNHPIYLQPFVEPFAMEADFCAFRLGLLAQEPSHWAESDFPPLSSDQGPYFFVLYRNDQVQSQPLSEAQYRLLSAFKQGATVEEACASLGELAAAAAPFIAEWFRTWAELNWFRTAASSSAGLRTHF